MSVELSFASKRFQVAPLLSLFFLKKNRKNIPSSVPGWSLRAAGSTGGSGLGRSEVLGTINASENPVPGRPKSNNGRAGQESCSEV